MPDHRVQPLFDLRWLALGVIGLVALVTWSFAPFFAEVSKQPHVNAFWVGVALSLLTVSFPVAYILRENRARRAAARGDETRARLIALASPVPFTLPIVLVAHFPLRHRQAAPVAVLGSLFFVGVGWLTQVQFGPPVLAFFAVGPLVIAGAYFLTWERQVSHITLTEAGIERRSRWTRQMIPWHEVRQLWMEYPLARQVDDALLPPGGAAYEVASARTRLRLVVAPKVGDAGALHDAAAYQARVASALAAIMERGGVALWGPLPRKAR